MELPPDALMLEPVARIYGRRRQCPEASRGIEDLPSGTAVAGNLDFPQESTIGGRWGDLISHDVALLVPVADFPDATLNLLSVTIYFRTDSLAR